MAECWHDWESGHFADAHSGVWAEYACKKCGTLGYEEEVDSWNAAMRLNRPMIEEMAEALKASQECVGFANGSAKAIPLHKVHAISMRNNALIRKWESLK